MARPGLMQSLNAAEDSRSGREWQASDENCGEIWRNGAMKRECDISMKRSEISDEDSPVFPLR